MSSKKDIEKTRYFAFLIYPDSVPEGWIGKLEMLGKPIAISPLHDKDTKKMKPMTDDKIAEEARKRAEQEYYGMDDSMDKLIAISKRTNELIPEVMADIARGFSVKKPHYHVIYIAENAVTSDSVRRKLKRILGENAVSMVKFVENVENYYLYLTHESKDAIEKHKTKYDKKDITLLNDFKVERYIRLDREKRQDCFVEISRIIRNNKIMTLIELVEYLESHKDEVSVKSESQLYSVVAEKQGILRMLFDSIYHIKKRSGYEQIIEEQRHMLEAQGAQLIKLAAAMKELQEQQRGQGTVE